MPVGTKARKSESGSKGTITSETGRWSAAADLVAAHQEAMAEPPGTPLDQLRKECSGIQSNPDRGAT